MILCLDTNAYSLLEKKHRSLCERVDAAERVLVPTIVLGELFAGFEMGSHRRENSESLQRFLALPGVDTIQVDEAIAERYGHLVAQIKRQGTPIPTNDIWVAATALENGARLLTYDTHFEHVPGLMILSP